MSVEAFFAYARERQSVLLRRRSGAPRPWTDDALLQQFRFCNVDREDDKTTIWFRDNVREPLRDKPEVLLATVLFRWFNRISTGEAVFTQTALGGLGREPEGSTSPTAWETWTSQVDMSDTSVLRSAIKSYCGDGPYVTGSYIIQGWTGMSKLDGVLRCVEEFCRRRHAVSSTAAGFLGGHPVEFQWRGAAVSMLAHGRWTLQDAWSWLRQFPYLGDFMAYEIVTDLRHTTLLDRAPDIMTWANPGPGAARGLGRVFRGDPAAYRPSQKAELNRMMRDLLEMSRSSAVWSSDWPRWEMRTVEHTLCEFDKYERLRLGEGRVKGVFR